MINAFQCKSFFSLIKIPFFKNEKKKKKCKNFDWVYFKQSQEMIISRIKNDLNEGYAGQNSQLSVDLAKKKTHKKLEVSTELVGGTMSLFSK